jgi:hypothetical protein
MIHISGRDRAGQWKGQDRNQCRLRTYLGMTCWVVLGLMDLRGWAEGTEGEEMVGLGIPRGTISGRVSAWGTRSEGVIGHERERKGACLF